MSTRRKHALIAAATGLVVAGAVIAIAATVVHPSRRVEVSVSRTALLRPPSTGTPSNPLAPGARLGGGVPFNGFFGGLSVAATYLGVTQSTLQSDLAGGKTLAQVATAQGKTADGLVSAMVAATQRQLSALVSSGRFTKQQEATIVASLEQRYKAMVNGASTGRGGFGGGGFGGGYGGRFGGGGQGSFGNGTLPA